MPAAGEFRVEIVLYFVQCAPVLVRDGRVLEVLHETRGDHTAQ